MQRALCAVNSLVNSMPDKPFYPVFLNMPKQPDWIPTQLKNSTCFQLNVTAFHEAVGNTDGLDDETLFRQAYHCFKSNSQFEDLLHLLKMLRGEIPKPPEPSSTPISLPSYAINNASESLLCLIK